MATKYISTFSPPLSRHTQDTQDPLAPHTPHRGLAGEISHNFTLYWAILNALLLFHSPGFGDKTHIVKLTGCGYCRTLDNNFDI